jgi:hypothetical protein
VVAKEKQNRHIPVYTTPITFTNRSDDTDSASRWSNSNNLIHIDLSQSSSSPLPSHDRQLRIASFNAQSLSPGEKRTAVCEFITDRQNDILFIQETWFRPTGDDGRCVDLAPSGYNVRSFPRSHRGGGLAIVHRDSLARNLGFTTDFPFQHTSFEAVQLTLSVLQHNINFVNIYRTFPSKKNKLTDAIFHREFPDLLDHFNTVSGNLVIVGDMNFHYDQSHLPSTAKMMDLLHSFSLNQPIDQPTHSKGHIIDWVLHRPIENLVRSTSVTQEPASDHYCVVCDLNVRAPPSPPVFKEARSLRTMHRDAFKHDLSVEVSPAFCPTVDALDSTLRT